MHIIGRGTKHRSFATVLRSWTSCPSSSTRSTIINVLESHNHSPKVLRAALDDVSSRVACLESKTAQSRTEQSTAGNKAHRSFETLRSELQALSEHRYHALWADSGGHTNIDLGAAICPSPCARHSMSCIP